MLVSFAPMGSVSDDWQLAENKAESKPPRNAELEKPMREYGIKRYGAYFKGWCQAFGEHESILVGERENGWLIGEKKVGLVLPKSLLRRLNGEVLRKSQTPEITFSQEGVQIGALCFHFESELERMVLATVEHLVDTEPDLHLFLTSHLLYGNGKRIITFSGKKPQTIIYKEIGNIKIRLQ